MRWAIAAAIVACVGCSTSPAGTGSSGATGTTGGAASSSSASSTSGSGSGSSGSSTGSSGSSTGSADAGRTGAFLYAAFNDGTVHVYDIDHGHQEVEAFTTSTRVRDVRGVCASAPTARLYLSHAQADAGYVVAIDLQTDSVLWERAYAPNVDRLSCTPDGSKLYVPSNENYTDDELIVLDGRTGDELTRIHTSPRPHDSVMSLSGDRVYLETKSSTYIDAIDTASDTVVEQIGPFVGIGGPFTIDGRERRVFGNFFGLNGFQVGSLVDGGAQEAVTVPGQTSAPGGLNQHGIALSPDETELWIPDHSAALVHIFDVTREPPALELDLPVSHAGVHWIAFDIDGRFAYPSASKYTGDDVDVVDAKSHTLVGTIGPSEDMLEVDFDAGAVVRVGSQFGVGRVP